MLMPCLFICSSCKFHNDFNDFNISGLNSFLSFIEVALCSLPKQCNAFKNKIADLTHFLPESYRFSVPDTEKVSGLVLPRQQP